MKVSMIVFGCLAIQFGITLLIGRFIRAGRDRRCTTAQAQPIEANSQGLPFTACPEREELFLTRSLASLANSLDSPTAYPVSESGYIPPRQARTA